MAFVYRSNIRRLINRSERAKNQVEREMGQFFADRVRLYIRQRTMRRTGRLRASVRLLRSGVGWVVRVGVGAGYYIFLERGTRYIQARRFIESARSDLRRQAGRIVRRSFKRALR